MAMVSLFLHENICYAHQEASSVYQQFMRVGYLYARSNDSDEPVHKHSLSIAFASHTHEVGMQKKAQ